MYTRSPRLSNLNSLSLFSTPKRDLHDHKKSRKSTSHIQKRSGEIHGRLRIYHDELFASLKAIETEYKELHPSRETDEVTVYKLRMQEISYRNKRLVELGFLNEQNAISENPHELPEFIKDINRLSDILSRINELKYVSAEDHQFLLQSPLLSELSESNIFEGYPHVHHVHPHEDMPRIKGSEKEKEKDVDSYRISPRRE